MKFYKYFSTLLFFLCSFQENKAQNTDLVDSSQTQLLADSGMTYLIPDMDTHAPWTRTSNKLFSLQIGAAILLDYSAFVQDKDSKVQVGKQTNQGDIRAARLMLRGKINFKHAWQYLISIEYKGFDRTEDMDAFGLTDLNIVIPVSKTSSLSFGKIKETFIYEMVGDAVNLPHTERILNPFFQSRNTGIMYRQALRNDRMSLSAGWYNTWFSNGGKFSENNNTYTTRLTALPVYEENGKRFFHFAASMRYVEAKNGTIRMKGKNESNVGSNYVDTKDFAADHALHLATEQLWSINNFSLLAEYVHTWAKMPTGYNEQFSGFYFTGSWVISGEQRPYDKKAAYARRVKPTTKGGAWEIVGRVSHLDLTTRNIEGGALLKLYAGVNWWATQHFRLSFGYGASNLEKDNLIGTTNSFLWRIQWVY